MSSGLVRNCACRYNRGMNEQLFQSGEWWKRSCWSEGTRKVYCPYPEEDIASAVETLKQYFNASWAADLAANPRQNVVFPRLCIGESTGAIEFVIYLGQMIQALSDAVGFQRLLSDLKGSKSESALLECEAAFAFADAGFKVQFPAEGESKTPDVLVDFDDAILAVECKRLRDEVWEDWEFKLTNRIISSLPADKDGKKVSANVALNTKLTQVFMSDRIGVDLNDAFLEAIVGEVSTKITHAVTNREIPFDINIGELASARIQYRGEGDYGSVSGMPRASPPITRRILQNGVMRASLQIPEDTPGIVFIYCKILPDAQFFKLFFDAACRAKFEPLRKIMSVVLCPLQTIFRHETPLVFLNESTTFEECRNNSLIVLRENFGCELVDRL